MPKKILQDIIVDMRPKRKTTSTIVSRTKKKQIFGEDNNGVLVNARKVRRSSFDRRGKNNFPSTSSSRFAIWFLAVSALVFFLFVLLSFFSATIIKIVPVRKEVVVSGPFRAVKNNEEEGLSFNLVVQEHSISDKISTTGEKRVQRKASGSLVIYNTYSSKSQKLIKRTRFETSNREVYRINKSIIVPGTTKVDGEVIPGSVEVVVYADIPGEEYNIGLTDFTIPGFRGDPRFSKFYARSKTPIIGGFSGNIKIASPEDIDKARLELQNSLKETLLAQARSEVPDDFVLYDDAVFFSFSELVIEDTEESKDKTIDVTLSGTLHGILFKKDELGKSIAENTITSYNGDNISIDNLDKLEFAVVSKVSFDPANDTEINFTLSGVSVVVWNIDSVSLARDLAGKDKESSLNIRASYSGIQRFEAIVRPFWEKTFPKDPDDISIRIMPADFE